MTANGQLAVITGASTGIGLELARCCAEAGFDLVVAADEPEIEGAAASLREIGVRVDAVQTDLATLEGVDRLWAATLGRPVEALLANAGRGLGRAFLDQDFRKARAVIDTNVTGTVYLIHRIGNDMRSRNSGRILITGFDRRFHSGKLPGGVQRKQSVPELFLLRVARGIEGYGSHRDLPDARRHRD